MSKIQVGTIALLLCVASSAQPLQAQSATGYAGYFSSPNGIGVYGYSSGDRSEPNPLAPGVYGESNQGVGVYGRGDISNTQSFNNEGGYFEGGKGIYARGTDSAGSSGYGARIFSTNYRGMFVQGGSAFFDAYFGGTAGISTAGIVDRLAATQSLVVNMGTSPIEPGDLVAMTGVVPSLESGQAMLGVAKVNASNLNAVIGVAKQSVQNRLVSFEDGSEHVDFQPTTGRADPENYLVVITGGLAPAVNLSNLALVSDGKIGERISLGAKTDGELALVLNREISRSPYRASAITIGKVAGAIDEISGTIPMFIDID
ncbi:hypothetical protein [Dokdonella sp.]|uniref:hypothetical protein n=1 Tax=Dokdonella sp. TaxID=2291710 RepID=UPI003C50159B